MKRYLSIELRTLLSREHPEFVATLDDLVSRLAKAQREIAKLSPLDIRPPHPLTYKRGRREHPEPPALPPTCRRNT